MPKVIFPYTKAGEAAARKAAKMHGGRLIMDKEKKSKKEPEGIGIMIAVGKAPDKKRRTRRKTKA